MGCASSKEAYAEQPVKQISGPVGVVKATPTFAALHEAQSGQLELRIVPDTAKHSSGSAKSSPKTKSSPRASASDHPKKIHSSMLRIESCTEPPSGVKKIRSAPLEIIPAEDGFRKGRSLTLPGGKASLATTPLAEKQNHRKAYTLEDHPRREKEASGPVRLDVDAFLAGKWSGASLAVGRCNTVSFSNPLKTHIGTNQSIPENPLQSAASSTAEPRRSSKDGFLLHKPPSPKPPSYVVSWLESLHLAQYASAFEAAGYEESDTLTDLSNSDLAQIERYTGVTILPGHKKRLILASCRPSTGPAPSKPASPYDLETQWPRPSSVGPFLDADVGPLNSNGGKFGDRSRRPRSDRAGKLSDGATDVSGEIDGVSSRTTESANSSPASVLPSLVLPQALAEARRGGHSIRGKSTPLAGGPLGDQARPLEWANENRKPLSSREGDSANASVDGTERRESLKGGVVKSELCSGVGGSDLHRKGPPRRSKRSPRRSNSQKAAGTWGDGNPEGAVLRGVLAPQKVDTTEGGGQNVGKTAELQALRAQVQKKVAELQLIHAKDMQASQLSPAARV